MKRILPAAVSSISLSLALFSACSAQTALLDRVEPPFWWQGFKHQKLQLLVHGDNIGNLTPTVDYPGVKVARVERVKNDNYLFIYLQIDAEAPAGELDIQFSGAGEMQVYKYELRSKNSDPAHATGFTAADSIYLITPDRFVNGDPSNDNHIHDHLDTFFFCLETEVSILFVGTKTRIDPIKISGRISMIGIGLHIVF